MTLHVGIFSAQKYDEVSFSRYKNESSLHFHFIPAALTEETAAACERYDVVCAFVNDRLDAAVLNTLARCGVSHVAMRCAGYNNLDIKVAKSLGIAVSRVPAYSPEAVAEHAVALMLTLNRKIHKAYNRVREGNFDLNGLLGFTLHNKVVGLIGTGHIGCATARILLGFGCHVIAYDPFPNDALRAQGVDYVGLDKLLSDSHIISLHCPLNEDSHHMINQDAIDKMRDNVMLINTSRGGLVDTKALIRGLKSHKIGYLGLDVYEMESELFFKDRSDEIIHDDLFERLATFHNVVITGHQGFFTEEALDQIARTTISNILAYHNGTASTDRFVVFP